MCVSSSYPAATGRPYPTCLLAASAEEEVPEVSLEELEKLYKRCAGDPSLNDESCALAIRACTNNAPADIWLAARKIFTLCLFFGKGLPREMVDDVHELLLQMIEHPDSKVNDYTALQSFFRFINDDQDLQEQALLRADYLMDRGMLEADSESYHAALRVYRALASSCSSSMPFRILIAVVVALHNGDAEVRCQAMEVGIEVACRYDYVPEVKDYSPTLADICRVGIKDESAAVRAKALQLYAILLRRRYSVVAVEAGRLAVDICKERREPTAGERERALEVLEALLQRGNCLFLWESKEIVFYRSCLPANASARAKRVFTDLEAAVNRPGFFKRVYNDWSRLL